MSNLRHDLNGWTKKINYLDFALSTGNFQTLQIWDRLHLNTDLMFVNALKE